MSEFIDEEEFDGEGERRAVRKRIDDEGHKPRQSRYLSTSNRWLDAAGGSACRGEI